MVSGRSGGGLGGGALRRQRTLAMSYRVRAGVGVLVWVGREVSGELRWSGSWESIDSRASADAHCRQRHHCLHSLGRRLWTRTQRAGPGPRGLGSTARPPRLHRARTSDPLPHRPRCHVFVSRRTTRSYTRVDAGTHAVRAAADRCALLTCLAIPRLPAAATTLVGQIYQKRGLLGDIIDSLDTTCQGPSARKASPDVNTV